MLYIIIVTVYICANPVVTLYCVELHSRPLVVLFLLPLFWRHAVSHVHVHPLIILTHHGVHMRVVRVPRVVLCPLSYLLRVTSSLRNPLGITVF